MGRRRLGVKYLILHVFRGQEFQSWRSLTMNEPWHDWVPGVLNRHQMKTLVDEGLISIAGNVDELLDESSLDLTLSGEAYRMVHGSVKPAGGQTYHWFLNRKELSEKLSPKQDGSFLLPAKGTYIFKLQERLESKLGRIGVFGHATAKSSVGRVDVLVRLIVNGMDTYECFNPEALTNQAGDMYLEITPITFPVRVRQGISLSQLRLFYGDPRQVEFHGNILYRTIFRDAGKDDGSLTVDLENTNIGGLFASAFCADSVTPIDMADAIPLWEVDTKPDPCKHWSLKESVDGRLTIETERFYILRSKENISVPPGIAIYCRASDETIGEMRIHYAGFVHPWFGRRRADGKSGTPLIFEVRGHQVNVSLAHGERMANLTFYRMSQDATGESAPTKYEQQTLQLSKFFGPWPEKLKRNADGRTQAA